ncbi:hypothetical protein ACWED2_37730 [Amycolatopsis sp. NPDC005003]
MSESRRDDWLALGEQYAKIDGLLHAPGADYAITATHHVSAGTMDGVTGVLFGLVRMSLAQYSADQDARDRVGSRRRVHLEASDELFSDERPTTPPTIGA